MSDLKTSLDRVRREDILLYLNAGLTATGQGGFYHGSSEERLSLGFLHQYIAENYRRLYALLLAGGLNDYNTALAIFTLLSLGAPDDPVLREEENRLLGHAMGRLPPQRAYKLCERLAKAKVNNRRARALVRSYLAGRKSLAFDAVKYRHRMKKAVLHAHAGVSAEIKRFLFQGAGGSRVYQEPLLETYRKAQFDSRAIYALPFTVAQGLAQRKGIDQAEFMTKIAPRMTEREKLRWQNAGAAEFDPSRADMVELCLYFLRQRAAQRVDLLPILRQRAVVLAPRLQLPDVFSQGRVAAVLDRSRSSYGSGQARRRPLALALAVHLCLEAACPDYSAHWSYATAHLLDLHPTGYTGLGEVLLEALARRPSVLLVVSDGRENNPPGACQAIASAYESRVADSTPLWIHFNPVFDPDDFAPLSLGRCWPVVGLRRVEDLGTGFVLARFASGRCGVAELERYLEHRALEALRPEASLAVS